MATRCPYGSCGFAHTVTDAASCGLMEIVRLAPDRRTAEEWVLVLVAEGIEAGLAAAEGASRSPPTGQMSLADAGSSRPGSVRTRPPAARPRPHHLRNGGR